MTFNTAFTAAFALACIAAGTAKADPFALRSGNLKEGGTLPATQVLNGFGCNGADKSPAVAWSDAPSGTLSYAFTMYDPDAPTGSGWWHWTVFDLPPSTTALPEGASTAVGALPEGSVQGRTDYGANAYGGVCPPPGAAAHHYKLTVWALKVPKLGLDAGASGAMVGYAVRANALTSSTLTLTYGVPKK